MCSAASLGRVTVHASMHSSLLGKMVEELGGDTQAASGALSSLLSKADVTHFAPPHSHSCTIVVAAKHDACVRLIAAVRDAWRGASGRVLSACKLASPISAFRFRPSHTCRCRSGCSRPMASIAAQQLAS